jgi:hypothetical protein
LPGNLNWGHQEPQSDRRCRQSAIGDDEARGIATALTQGDPNAAAGLLQAASVTLTDENFQATLSSKPLADAVAGMMGSQNPARMLAGMQAAEKLWTIDPTAAEQALGASAADKLHSWQGLKGMFSPQEIAANLNAITDPTMAKVRDENRKAAMTETVSLSPSDMAYKLGTGWPLLNTVTGNITGATPNIPFDANAASVMVSDYRAAYSAIRADGVPASEASDLALKRLQSVWGVSAAAGNQLMRRPPESFYKPIGGLQEWIASDLNAWIAARAGPEFTKGPRSLEAGTALAGAERRWTIAGLIADRQTERDIAAGRAPSYQVAIKRADGTLEILGTTAATAWPREDGGEAVWGAAMRQNNSLISAINRMAGSPRREVAPEFTTSSIGDNRIRFDPTPHLQRYAEQAQIDMAQTQINVWAHGGDRQDFLHFDKFRQGNKPIGDRPSYLFGESLPE